MNDLQDATISSHLCVYGVQSPWPSTRLLSILSESRLRLNITSLPASCSFSRSGRYRKRLHTPRMAVSRRIYKHYKPYNATPSSHCILHKFHSGMCNQLAANCDGKTSRRPFYRDSRGLIQTLRKRALEAENDALRL